MPILPLDHPLVRKALQNPDSSEVRRGMTLNDIKFHVLLKTSQIESVCDIPRENRQLNQVQGVIINDIRPLKAEGEEPCRSIFAGSNRSRSLSWRRAGSLGELALSGPCWGWEGDFSCSGDGCFSVCDSPEEGPGGGAEDDWTPKWAANLEIHEVPLARGPGDRFKMPSLEYPAMSHSAASVSFFRWSRLLGALVLPLLLGQCSLPSSTGDAGTQDEELAAR